MLCDRSRLCIAALDAHTLGMEPVSWFHATSIEATVVLDDQLAGRTPVRTFFRREMDSNERMLDHELGSAPLILLSSRVRNLREDKSAL
jgi:hypothetical protein